MWGFLKAFKEGCASREAEQLGGAQRAKERLLSERRRDELAVIGTRLREALAEALGELKNEGAGGCVMESSFDVEPSELGGRFRVVFSAEIGEPAELPACAGESKPKKTRKTSAATVKKKKAQ